MRLKINAKIRFGNYLCFGSLICDMSTNLFFNASCGFPKYQERFNQKIYLRGKSGSSNYLFLLWMRLSKKKKNLSLNNHFLPLQKLY